MMMILYLRAPSDDGGLHNIMWKLDGTLTEVADYNVEYILGIIGSNMICLCIVIIYVLLMLGDTGRLAKGLSHNSVNSCLLFDDVPITILSHQNCDFLDIPSFEAIINKSQKHVCELCKYCTRVLILFLYNIMYKSDSKL